MYRARRGAPKSIFSGSLCSLFIGSTSRILSVFCSNFVLPVSILNSWWSVNWVHIRCDKCTRRNRLEFSTLSCNEGSIRLRPEWPWRARRYRIAPEESVQYWNLFLFPLPPAMLLPLVVRPMMTIHKMILKIIFYSPELDYHDEEDWSVSSTLNNRRANILVVQYQSKFSHQKV